MLRRTIRLKGGKRLQRRGNITEKRLAGVVQQTPKCILRSAKLTDADGVFSNAVEYPSVPSEPALNRKRVRDVLDQDVVGVGKERPEVNARVSRDRAIEAHMPGHHVKYAVRNPPLGNPRLTSSSAARRSRTKANS